LTLLDRKPSANSKRKLATINRIVLINPWFDTLMEEERKTHQKNDDDAVAKAPQTHTQSKFASCDLKF
jgi:hypothetical protein